MRSLLVGVLLASVASVAASQSPRRSQRAEVMQMVGETEIRAMYIRPVARGRALFGALVPFGKIWTPSADTAMRISFSTAVEVEGQALPAGSYSVWAIPDSTHWTIIFNKVSSAFHLRHRESEDALRVNAKVDSLPHVETLTLGFPLVEGRMAVLQFHWGATAVSLRINAPE